MRLNRIVVFGIAFIVLVLFLVGYNIASSVNAPIHTLQNQISGGMQVYFIDENGNIIKPRSQSILAQSFYYNDQKVSKLGVRVHIDIEKVPAQKITQGEIDGYTYTVKIEGTYRIYAGDHLIETKSIDVQTWTGSSTNLSLDFKTVKDLANIIPESVLKSVHDRYDVNPYIELSIYSTVNINWGDGSDSGSSDTVKITLVWKPDTSGGYGYNIKEVVVQSNPSK